jgi:hypothetical protein
MDEVQKPSNPEGEKGWRGMWHAEIPLGRTIYILENNIKTDDNGIGLWLYWAHLRQHMVRMVDVCEHSN